MTDDHMELAPYRRYLDMLGEGVLGYQRCELCDRAIFQPRLNCTDCGSTRLRWEASSGRGTVYSATEVITKEGRYNVVLIDLDDGFRMMSTIVGDQGGSIGSRVTGHVERTGEAARFVFEVIA